MPACPVCESERKPEDGLLSALGAPARRALERIGVSTPEELAEYRQAEIMKLHGMGPGSLPKLKAALAEKGLSFKT